jgi:thymidylate synthase
MKIDKFYKDIVCKQIAKQKAELNKRTGIKTRSLPGITYQTDISKEGFPLLSLRKLPFSFIPEIMWMLSGSNTNEWLSKHTKIWDSFIEEGGLITSAYGFRWRHHFDVDQLDVVLNKLKNDKSTRHGVIMMWSPKEDLLIKQKNVPCPYAFTLNIISKKLHLHLVIRSNDMVLGFPTDVTGFALLQYILAQELGVGVGTLTISISNAHIYENQMEAVKEMSTRHFVKTNITFKLPKDSYKRACELDDTLIDEIKKGFKNYDPYPAIKNIPIAL